MIVTVEGNIGAGKTSFAKSLHATMKRRGRKTVYIPEPVDSWTDLEGVNLLDLLYSDRRRWVFTFQINALLDAADSDRRAMEYACEGYTVIRERSSFSTRNIFVPLCMRGMSVQERHILKTLCESIEEASSSARCSSCKAEDVTVYLRTDPEICLERVIRRARPEEVGDGRVDLSYLTQLHELHEQEMSKIRESGSRLVVADGNAFDKDDPRTVKGLGCGCCCILNTIDGITCGGRDGTTDGKTSTVAH